MKQALIDWLIRLGYDNVLPIILTIGDESFVGVAYTHNGDRRFYFIGEPPEFRKTCYVYLGRTFYITGYVTTARYKELNKDQLPHHPFGPNFSMRIWDFKRHGDIDIAEKTPYKRVPIVIEGLTFP